MQVLTSVSFTYVMQQDRVLAVVNPGTPAAWSCWLTRRVALALLEQAAGLLAKTSPLARRAPPESRQQVVAFEHQAAMTQTAGSVRAVPANSLQASAARAELVERLSITNKAKTSDWSCTVLPGALRQGWCAEPSCNACCKCCR